MTNLLKLSAIFVLALGFTFFPTAARAQDDNDDLFESEEDEEEFEDEDDEDEEETDAEEDEDEEETDAEEEDAEGEDEVGDGAEGSAAELSDDSQTIYVVQGKPRLRNASIEFSPQVLTSLNDKFVSHQGAAFTLLYNLKENIALELAGGGFMWSPILDAYLLGEGDTPLFFDDPKLENLARIGGHDSITTLELRKHERLTPEMVKLYYMTWFQTFSAQWSPINGKFSLHDTILGQFSLFLSVGGGLAGVQNDQADNLESPFDLDFIQPIRILTTIGGGLRFYLFDWLGFRLEVRDYVLPLSLYQRQSSEAVGSTFEVRNTVMVQAGVTFVVPMPWR